MLGGTTVYSGTQAGTTTATDTETQARYQYDSAVLHQEGSYSGATGWALSSYVMDAASSLSAMETATGLASVSPLGTLSSGGTYSGTGYAAYEKTSRQSRSGSLHLEGSYSSGQMALGCVAFTEQGAHSFTTTRVNSSSFTGCYSASDSLTMSLAAEGSYSATGRGSYSNLQLNLTSFVLTGWSQAASTFLQTGSADGNSYDHQNHWSERTSHYQAGTFSGTAWSLSSYLAVQSLRESAHDTVGTTSGHATITSLATTTANGQKHITAAGTYVWKGDTYWYHADNTTSGNVATGPALAGLIPVAATGGGAAPVPVAGQAGEAANGLRGTGLGQAALGPVLDPLVPKGPGGAAALLRTAPANVGLPVAYKLPGLIVVPDVRTSVSATGSPYSLNFVNQKLPLLAPVNFVGRMAGGGLPGTSWPGTWLEKLDGASWNLVNQSFKDAANKLTMLQSFDPKLMRATQVFCEGTAGNVGAENGQDFWQWWRDVKAFVWGVLDTVSFGLTARMRNGLNSWLFSAGLEGLMENVDTSSSAYLLGGYVGQGINIWLSVINPLGAAGKLFSAVRWVQMGGNAWNAVDAFAAGDIKAGLMGVVGMALSGMRAWAGSNSFCRAFGSYSAGVSKSLANTGRALGIVGGGMNIEGGIERIKSGDILGGVLDMIQGAVDIRQSLKACFTAEMLLDVEGGKKRADAIQEGDLLWARDEFDPNGPLALKEVEEVFTRVAPVLNVHVAGQVIRTTAEHPFYVVDKGWIPAWALGSGDLLLTRHGLAVAVEGVADSGQVETVYNWRIADYHTYFVSATEARVSIWAHNLDGCKIDKAGDKYVLTKDGKPVNGKDGRPISSKKLDQVQKKATAEGHTIEGGAPKKKGTGANPRSEDALQQDAEITQVQADRRRRAREMMRRDDSGEAGTPVSASEGMQGPPKPQTPIEQVGRTTQNTATDLRGRWRRRR